MKRTILFLFVTSLLVGSCSFWNDDYRETVDQFVSVAYKADNVDFTQYKTFAIADSILYVEGDKNERKKNNLSEEVKAVVENEMTALGYKLFAPGKGEFSTPDLIVDLAYIVNTTTVVYPGYWWDWDYWWYYYDWYPYDPFFPYYPYDPFYPYYPYPMYPMASSYSSGSLTIDIVDVKNMGDDSNPPIVWHGLVRSILNSTHTSSERAAAIGQCFDMVPPANTK